MRQSATVAACIVRARAGEAVDRRRYAPLLLGLYLAANVLFIWLQTAVGNWFTTGPLARLNLLLGLLMAGTALVEARGRLLRKRTILSAPFVSMVAILIIACLLALLGRGTGTGLYRYVTYTAILGTAALCITKPFDLELALALYLVGCLVSAGVGLYCWGSQTALYLVQGANVAEVGLRSSRLVGANTDPSSFGVGIALVLPFCLASATRLQRRWLFWPLTLCLAGLTAAIIASVSRSAMIVAGVGLLVMTRQLGKAATRTLLVSGLCLLAALWLLRGYPQISDTARITQGRLAIDSRSDVWGNAAIALMETGMVGRGPGSEELRTRLGLTVTPNARHANPQLSAHNVYLSMGVELGWPGFLAVCVALVSAYRILRRATTVSERVGLGYSQAIGILRAVLLSAAVGMTALNVVYPMTLVALGCSVSPLLCIPAADGQQSAPATCAQRAGRSRRREGVACI